MPARLSDIIKRTPPISADKTTRAVFNKFLSDPDLLAVAVVEGHKPIGMVTCHNLITQLASPDGAAILPSKPISLIMEKNFATVDAKRTVAAVAQRAAELKPEVFIQGVVTVHNGKYAGIVSPDSILTVLAKENAARAKAMKASDEKFEVFKQKYNSNSNDTSRFLAMMGHEIRTPLSGVLGVADLLVDSGLSKEQKRYAHTIASSGRLLDRVLTDMLDLSRLDAGKLEINAEPIALRDFAKEARDLWTAKTADKELALRINIARGSAKRIVADGMRLRQILFNLMSNALKFTKKGYVDVELGTRKSELGTLVFTMKVSDTGCGISDEHKHRLFKDFEQANAGTAVQYGGSGLGLAISKSLAELMGGTIELHDNPAGGSIFTVQVGVEAMGPRLAVDNPKRPKRGRLELGDILVIEDHQVSQMVIDKALTAAGWNVDCVYTGEQGLKRASGKTYQAILIDRHLPDGMGEDILEGVRAEAAGGQTVPVLLVTADVSPERREAAGNAGFDSFIAKPIRPRELVAALADVLMHRDTNQIVRRANAV